MRAARRLDGWLAGLGLLIAFGVLGYFASRYAIVGDWSANGRSSLAAPSRAVLARLKGPVQIVSYANPQGELRRTIAAFVARYQRLKPDLRLSFVDPQLDPGKMRALGISVNGEMIVHYRGHEARLDEISEASLSNALERLARGGTRIVAFVTGDGERRADGVGNADLGRFVSTLEPTGVRAVPLNFSQAANVPDGTDLVVLASPAAPLSDGAIKALVDYLATGGNLLWLTDPGNADLHLQPLAEALGVRVLPGVLVDGQGAALGLHDPRIIATDNYPPMAIVRGFVLDTLFPQVAALAKTGDSQWAVEPFLRSSAQSWTEFHPIDPIHPSTIRYDAAAGELRGPLDFGYALHRLSPSPDKREQRAVVIGNGDFLSNSFLGNGGNRALGERIFDWLLGDDALVDLPPRSAPDRLLAIGQGTLDAVSYGFLIGLPLLLLLGGGLIAWRRRRA